MKTFGEIKNTALKALENNWGEKVAITFVYEAIAVVASLIGQAHHLVNIVLLLAILPLSYSLAIVFLKTIRNTGSKVAELFDGYKDFERIFPTMLLRGVYTVLWSLLLVIPGIVKALSYSMTEFVLHDNPNLKYDAAITRSSQLMRGHKMDLFLFALSFIGWFLLACLTLGIGFLWFTPYYTTAKAEFYQELLREESARSGNADVEVLEVNTAE